MKVWRKIFTITAITVAGLLIMGIVSFTLLLEPNFPIGGWQKLDTNKLTNMQRTVRLLDKNDRIIEDSIYGKDKIFTPIDKIPLHTIDAFVSIEDKRFYKHAGIDYIRVLGALKNNIFSSSYKEGASTITQQLIKNTHLSNKKTLTRKIQEMRIARALERNYTKSQILEMYLNILYFGNNIYGIGTAAQLLFGVAPEALSLSQSALLAGIINNPSRYNPYRNPDNATARRNLVLETMASEGKITADICKKAKEEPLHVLPLKVCSNQYLNGVLKEATELLHCREEDLFRHNVTIGTNMEKDFQDSINSIMSDIVLENDAIAHIIIVENETGRVISDVANSQINLAYTKRQPGSTIKPILCYGPAMEKKDIFTVTPILDEPTTIDGYSPSNYKNKYYGWTTVNDCLKHSLNIPAVKLLKQNGVEYSKSFARNCGIHFCKEDDSLALALGGMHKGVTLLEMANAYQTLGNRGKYIKASYIEYIRDGEGNTLYEAMPTEKQVFKESTAFLLTDMLCDCAVSGTAKKLRAMPNVAAKTGTVGNEKGNSDAYCIAYTPQYTVSVWFGAKDNKTATQISGGGLPTQTNRTILERLKLNTQAFTVPESVVQLDIDIRPLENEHRVVLAGGDILPRYRKSVYFALDNTPKEYSYNALPDMFSDDFAILDMDNFRILDGIL